MALEKPGGGDSGGSSSYKVLLQRPDVLVQGVNDVVDAVTVTVQDGIYGIVFSFTRSRSSWEGGAVQAAASFYAGMVQAMAGYQHTQGMAYTQDTNASGQLVDQIVVTVGTDDGSQQASFTWPLETIGEPAAFAKADQVFENLMTVASSTGG